MSAKTSLTQTALTEPRIVPILAEQDDLLFAELTVFEVLSMLLYNPYVFINHHIMLC